MGGIVASGRAIRRDDSSIFLFNRRNTVGGPADSEASPPQCRSQPLNQDMEMAENTGPGTNASHSPVTPAVLPHSSCAVTK